MRKTLYNNLRQTFGACPWTGPASGGSDGPATGRASSHLPTTGKRLVGRPTWRRGGGGEWGKREGWQSASGTVHSEYSEEMF